MPKVEHRLQEVERFDEQRPDVKLTEAGGKHPVLAGVKPFTGTGGLYKNPAVARDVTILMNGSIPDHSEPVTWVRENKGGRVFYTSLGHREDVRPNAVVHLLAEQDLHHAGELVR